ncbi:MAG: sterol desaturase family protein [Pseudobacter sp.]|uniref:sterol desaturase family protein n=1 Tax=Pseudobacter sp. TaxID=2045420 RepID=UPI003F7D6333
MNTLQQQFVTLVSTPFYVIIIGIEVLLSSLHHTGTYHWKDTVHNFTLSILGGLTDLLMRAVSLAVMSFCFARALFSLPHTWIYWIILVLAVDFLHYWLHRLSHTSRFFWAVHVNHHSSPHFNFTTGFRAAVLEPFYRFIFYLPLPFIGFQPIDVLLVYSILEIWAICTHTEKIKSLGILEFILVTPSHHRVHHGSNIRYLDKNMGSAFIIWDKLFGTFQQELPAKEYEPIRYGLTSPLKNENIPSLVLHEWRGIWADLKRKDITWKQKIQYVFRAPGWSHDGSRRTSHQLRECERIGRIE